MSANPPESGAPQSHVFRARDEFQGLTEIAPEDWQQIVQHALPLEPANAAVRLIVITGTVFSREANRETHSETGAVTIRQAVCNSIEALQVQTDSFGFLRNWDANVAQSLPPLNNIPNTARVIDSRQQFLRRYLSHRHSWQPPTPLIAEALLRSGYSDTL